MNIIFFSHPTFLGSQSMPRFVGMLAAGMQRRGFNVDVLQPAPFFYRIPLPSPMRKWLGYIDQYLMFPREVRRRVNAANTDTLYVFTDHALGPWIPLVSGKPHVVHCHDFLAQQSANGLIAENRTRWTGRIYQKYIRDGYRSAKNFISVSRKTKDDLHSALCFDPEVSEVVYNGVNRRFLRHDQQTARRFLAKETGLDLDNGYILHVGGNQWYKNRPGVIQIYNAYRAKGQQNLPLVMVGKDPDARLLNEYRTSQFQDDIHFVSGLEDDTLPYAYSGASVFLFPSIAEGFGWPIAEAMACGCPVITTARAPMTEVAGDAAFLIPACNEDISGQERWARHAAETLNEVLELRASEIQMVIDKGLNNIARFDLEHALDKIESIYRSVLEQRPKDNDRSAMHKSDNCL
jgi:glycosyltransferase involved in cell wall biosynthesis